MARQGEVRHGMRGKLLVWLVNEFHFLQVIQKPVTENTVTQYFHKLSLTFVLTRPDSAG